MGEKNDSTSNSQSGGSGSNDSSQSSDKMLAGQKADPETLAANAAEKGFETVEKAGGKEGETYDTPSASEISIPSSVNPEGSPNEAAQGSGDSGSSGDE